MRTLLLALPLLLALTTPLAADDKADAAKVKKEIAATEARLAELKGLLAKIEGKGGDGSPTEFKNVGKFTPKTAEVGYEGTISTSTGQAVDAHEVHQVVDATTFVMDVVPGRPEQGKLLVVDFPTKGMADGKMINGERVWQVIGTRTLGRETLYVVREKKAATDVKTDPKKK